MEQVHKTEESTSQQMALQEARNAASKQFRVL